MLTFKSRGYLNLHIHTFSYVRPDYGELTASQEDVLRTFLNHDYGEGEALNIKIEYGSDREMTVSIEHYEPLDIDAINQTILHATKFAEFNRP
jgi:hypothetical protein